MYLDIVIIDILEPDGLLRTYKIRPKTKEGRVVIDRLSDIYPEQFNNDDLDLGGTRIYNSSGCSIERLTARMRAFGSIDNKIEFRFEHMGIPLGPSRESHGGIYNFLLSPGWRLTEFYLSDPYDKKHEDIKKKKQFRYQAIWDKECNVQLVNMDLRSGRGSFSFIASGSAMLFNNGDKQRFIEADESDWAVSHVTDNHLLDGNGKKALALDIAEKSDWLELKPNVFGIGINLNQILKDSISAFKRKLQKAYEKRIS